MICEVEARYPDRRVVFTVVEGMTVDEGLVRVIMANLINNAVKFTGKIAEPAIEIGADGSRFYVRENGAGKASELFRPFARLHNTADFPGTGIG